MIDFNRKAKEIFEQNKAVGWWDDMDRCIFQTMQLIVTEISEATEGLRKDLMDDHLPHRKMEEVELADAMIRMLDLGGRCGWVCENVNDENIDFAKEKIKLMKMSDAGCHLFMVSIVCELMSDIDYTEQYKPKEDSSTAYSTFIGVLLGYANAKGYDVISAMNEKLEYNKSRLDHKRENRSKQGGKVF